jgi:hypothetical protein
MNRACHRHTTGLALPDRRMIFGRAAAVGAGKDDFGAKHASAARCGYRQSPQADGDLPA